MTSGSPESTSEDATGAVPPPASPPALPPAPAPPPHWSELPDERLLERKISRLGLRIEGTDVEPLVARLHAELAAKGLAFMPPCHVGDEWFVPVGVPMIFVPFFLVHERLRRLERKIILEVEGDEPEWFMRLIRHEAGHAYSYAYSLYRKRKWQQTFGLASTAETEFYRPRPYSRSFVTNLDDGYAQSHPDEDFAETFAVWLAPDSDWRAKYAGWNALAKLEYVDELMRSIAGKPPTHAPACRVSDYDCLGVKLKSYYAQKRQQYEDAYPDFHDRDLRALFAAGESAAERVKAAAWLRKRRRMFMATVCKWTNERKYRVDGLLARLIARCGELGLHAPAGPGGDGALEREAAAWIATLVTTHRFTGKFKRTR
ncbi:MAG: hypothetical protein HMLKMBBP_00222 [Planctomycetes bacterium]|nr:hypothetical protein [Planctomycetota bacterium]